MEEKDSDIINIEEDDNNQEIITTSLIEKDENKINEENNSNKIEEIKEQPIDNSQSEKESNLNISSKIYIDKTSELNGKTLYHIKGDFIDINNEVIRRYRDFDLLHVKLVQNWPGIFIPPIAQKKYFGSLDKKTINERIYQLDNFLKISTKMEYLIHTEELKIFLNKDISNSDSFQLEIKKLKPYTLKQISENYTKYFSIYKKLKTQDFNDEQINICLEFINSFITKLDKYKEQLVEFGEVKKTKIYRESRITTYFTEFEKYCVMEYANNDLSLLFFFNNSSSLFDNKNKYKKYINNPYLLLSCWLRLKEIELISIKNNLNEYKSLLTKKKSIENKQKEIEQKLKDVEDGKISFLDKLMMKGNLKEKYKNELDIQNNEVKYINNIVDILTDYLSVEVYKYFDELKTSFYNTVKRFATIQKENCTLASDLWLKVKCKKNNENEYEYINDIFDIIDENIDNNNIKSDNIENNIKNENSDNNIKTENNDNNIKTENSDNNIKNENNEN